MRYPVTHRAREIVALVGRSARQRERLGVAGRHLQCALHELFGLAAKTLHGGDDIGPVGQHVRVVGHHAVELCVGRGGLGVVLQDQVSAREHGPTLGVVGLFLQARLERADHVLHLVLREALLSGEVFRVQRIRFANRQVRAHGRKRNAQGHRSGPDTARARVGGLRGFGCGLTLFERTALELFTAAGMAGGVDLTGGELGVELGELLTQHLERHRALARLLAAPMRAHAEQGRQNQ